MDKIAVAPSKDRSELFRQTAAQRRMSPAVVEKDFWVCWILVRLFTDDFFKEKLLFKGGTTLSKVFGLIERFSEDIDLILDWNEVVKEDPNLGRSMNKQDRFNKETVNLARTYLQKDFLPRLQRILEPTATASIQITTRRHRHFLSDRFQRDVPAPGDSSRNRAVGCMGAK